MPVKKPSALPIRESKVKMEGRTGVNRGTPSTVDFTQELGAWDPAVASKSVHHPRARCYGRRAAQHAMAKCERENNLIGRWSHPYPQKNIAPMTITYQKPSLLLVRCTYQSSQEMLLTIRTIAPFFSTVSRKICVTG
jgi:hypothetical protein